MRVVRRGLRVLVTVAITLVIAGAGFVVLAPRVTHGEALVVLTGSMRPSIPPGSLVFVHPVAAGDIQAGQVLTYQTRSGKSSLVTHRVKRVQVDSSGVTYIFKGDANNVADPKPVSYEAIHGRVWLSVPYVGEARALAGTPLGYLLLIVAPGVAYVVSQVREGRRQAMARRAAALETTTQSVQHA